MPESTESNSCLRRLLIHACIFHARRNQLFRQELLTMKGRADSAEESVRQSEEEREGLVAQV